MASAHDITFQGIDGAPLALSAFAGRPILVVNVASACGFTPQYAPLQALWEAQGADGAVVLGVPCNDFGAQEPGSDSQIRSFCETRFGVTFPMTAKVSVTDPLTRHPFYAWVAEELGEDALPRWNFHKFVIARDGTLAGSFSSRVAPDSAEIAAALA
jgi:glutathione peroxidase